MAGYILRRLGWMLIVLFGVMTATYFLTSFLQADPARLYLGPHATTQELIQMHHILGLDQPKYVQFAKYVWLVLHGNLGRSVYLDQPVLQVILDRLPATAQLAVAIILVQVSLSLVLGSFAAMNEGALLDRTVAVLAALGVSLPGFWLGFLLLYFVAFRLALLPLGGYGSPLILYIILPAVTVGVPGAFAHGRVVRTSVVEALHQDYIRTARSKGLARWRILMRHALPNALIPVVTLAALEFGNLLGGVVLIETVFSWPGIGFQAFQAMQTSDVPVVMGTVLFVALSIALMNIVADVLRATLDPRVRLA